jgi:hypothetical protein
VSQFGPVNWWDSKMAQLTSSQKYVVRRSNNRTHNNHIPHSALLFLIVPSPTTKPHSLQQSHPPQCPPLPHRPITNNKTPFAPTITSPTVPSSSCVCSTASCSRLLCRSNPPQRHPPDPAPLTAPTATDREAWLLRSFLAGRRLPRACGGWLEQLLEARCPTQRTLCGPQSSSPPRRASPLYSPSCARALSRGLRPLNWKPPLWRWGEF